MIEARITVFTKVGGPLTKRISLDDGKVKADGSACFMTEGEAEVIPAPTASALAGAITELDQSQAIALGVLREGKQARVVTRDKLNGHPVSGLIARTKSEIVFREKAPAWALIDFDTKGMPPEVEKRLEELGGFLPALAKILPGLEGTARVVRASTSAGLRRKDTGERLPGGSGMHVYVLVQDGADIPRFLRVLHDRAWLAGLGWMIAGASGQALERSIVDRMVGSPERLVFEGPPDLDPLLEQDAEERRPKAYEGQALDTLAAVPPLTLGEEDELKRRKAAEKERIREDLARARAAFIARQAGKIAAARGISVQEARVIAERYAEGILLPDVPLPFDRPELAGRTVADVLANPKAYEGETLADPIEGPEYGRGVAKVMLRRDGSPWLHSFAHGRTVYELRYDRRTIEKAIEALYDAGEAPDRARVIETFVQMAVLGQLSETDTEILIERVSSRTGVNKRAIVRDLKEAEKRKRAEWTAELREQQMVERDDPRPSIEAPAHDAPWLPVMKTLNDVLGSSTEPEPPFRDVEGWLCEVRERRIASLHLLTQGGANAEQTGEALDTPPQPLITRLGVNEASELIERHIDFYREDGDVRRSVHLPPAFVDHYLRRPGDKALPIVAAVLTLPVRTRRGLLAGRGLDRELGVVFRIPEWMLSVLPEASECTHGKIASAMHFLTNEWLVDVPTNYAGKCVLIALALTLIERAVLPQRPAFFVTAPQRGTGKTTTVNMISAGVLGRAAAAAAWSRDDEERRKALFACLAEGADMVVWDNIPRGGVVKCPSIEKALTAETYSDRVLGTSEHRTVPATTVQVFTGNNIHPGGDMASRSFIAHLEATQPDPENRPFKHTDPIRWSIEHRGEILHALYTLLLGNPALQPGTEESKQPAETRFKEWWWLVGSAVEYAAKVHAEQVHALLLDDNPAYPAQSVRFRDLAASSEEEDEQTAALAGFLTICQERWNGKFTAALLVQALKGMDDAAAELIATLETAIGRSIKNFTSRTVSWQLKSIVGMPCVINGRTYALRFYPDTHGGVFRVEAQR
jgi:hypothetical protein